MSEERPGSPSQRTVKEGDPSTPDAVPAPGADEETSPGDETAAPEPATTGSGAGSPAQSPNGLGQRVLGGLRHGAAVGASTGGRVAAQFGHAAEAMALEIVPTSLRGERVLVGHVLGMHLELPASHLHGPREAPSLLYLFADAVGVRETDDAPMSTVPILGLHMLLPPLAIARWVYKAGRIEHANLDLVQDAQRFADSLAQWTVDDFAAADPKLRVHRTKDVPGPVHVYQHVGFANVWIPSEEGRPTRLKSALPATSDAFVKLWQLFTLANWPNGVSTEVPTDAHEAQGGEPAGEPEPGAGS